MINERNQSILDKTKDTDEPVIVFRAQDAYSTEVLDAYLHLLIEDRAAGQDFIDEVQRIYNEFAAWQEANVDRVKTPDL